MNILEIIKSKKTDDNVDKGIYTFINPYSYLVIRKEKIDLCGFDGIFLDGISIVKIFKYLGIGHFTRISFDMTSLASKVLSSLVENSNTVYFIGTKPEIIEQFVSKITKEFHGINVSGYRNGYFIDDKDKDNEIKNIINLNPDCVVVGMGTPFQEKFLMELKEGGWNGLGFTCGGFFHQTAKKINYYPEIFNKYNLRWLYRIYDEPKLAIRYFIDYPKFLLLFACDYLRYLAFRRFST